MFFHALRKNISDRIKEMIEYMMFKHNKVLPVRIDLHFPFNYYQDGSNRESQNFERNVNRYFSYRGIDVVILVVREQNDSHNPHYHVFMCVDGNKHESGYNIFMACEKIWAKIIKKELLETGWDLPIIEEDGPSGLVHYCGEMEMIRRQSRFAEGDVLANQQGSCANSYETAVDHAMYLAKEITKGNAPKGTREMLGSQIPKTIR